jgi:hypothetical protein
MAESTAPTATPVLDEWVIESGEESVLAAIATER